MKSWVKLYTDTNHDPRTITLTWAQRGIWAALLALAGEMDVLDEQGAPTGELDTIAYTALRIRCDLPEFQEALAAFAARGMAEVRDGAVVLCCLAERQTAPSPRRWAAPCDQQPTPRASQAVTSMSQAVTSSPDVVTSASQAVTPPDTDTDTDPDTEYDDDDDARATPVMALQPDPPERGARLIPRNAAQRAIERRKTANKRIFPQSGRASPLALAGALRSPPSEKRPYWTVLGKKTVNAPIRVPAMGDYPCAGDISPPGWGAPRSFCALPWPSAAGWRASRPSAPG